MIYDENNSMMHDDHNFKIKISLFQSSSKLQT
jgi:hypothetical protein